MPNRNYARGVAFERWMVAWLRGRGFVAMRTPGSHGAFDVIALRNMHTPGKWLIQCKKRCRPAADEVESLLDAAGTAGATPVVAYWKRGGFNAFLVTESLEEKPITLS